MMDTLFTPLIQNGIPADLVYFLLLIPFVVMLATFARHIAGIKIFGIFVTASMTFIVAFLFRKYTLGSVISASVVLIFIYLFSYYIKKLVNGLGLHYFSRISAVITLISILLLVVLSIIGRYPHIVSLLQLDKISAAAIVLVVLLSEYFSSHQSQKGIRISRQLFLNSLIFSIAIGFLVSWNVFEFYMITYPFLTLAFLTLTIGIGKYKGLRFSEMQRFREVDVDEDTDE